MAAEKVCRSVRHGARVMIRVAPRRRNSITVSNSLRTLPLRWAPGQGVEGARVFSSQVCRVCESRSTLERVDCQLAARKSPRHSKQVKCLIWSGYRPKVSRCLDRRRRRRRQTPQPIVDPRRLSAHSGCPDFHSAASIVKPLASPGFNVYCWCASFFSRWSNTRPAARDIGDAPGGPTARVRQLPDLHRQQSARRCRPMRRLTPCR